MIGNPHRLWLFPMAILAAVVGAAALMAEEVADGRDARRSGDETIMHGRALVALAGRVRAIELERDGAGVTWVEALLETDRDPEPIRVRLAPEQVLESEDFHVDVGDLLLVRAFSDESPPGAQRVRNRTTGRTLRLRCLHGVEVWSLQRASLGRLPAGSRRD